MDNKVYSFRQALEAGLNPRDYKWGTGNVPIGKSKVILDFKIWANDLLAAVGLYFTTSDGRKFRINSFRNAEGQYIVGDNDLNLKYCPTGVKYDLEIILNRKGNLNLFQ